jgi:prepilin-type N-terminal cleavage/methylation domain-containing protein
MHCPLSARRQAAYTLVELLVCIALIALLVALLFGVMARSREQAQSTICLSRLSQLGRAVSMYAADYDDALPFATTDENVKMIRAGRRLYGTPLDDYFRTGPDLRALLSAYGFAAPVHFQCPSDRKLNQSPNTPAELRTRSSWFEEVGDSYRYYGLVDGQVMRLSEHKSPSVSILAEEIEPFHQPSTPLAPGRWDALMADGHTKALDYDAEVAGREPPNR